MEPSASFHLAERHSAPQTGQTAVDLAAFGIQVADQDMGNLVAADTEADTPSVALEPEHSPDEPADSWLAHGPGLVVLALVPDEPASVLVGLVPMLRLLAFALVAAPAFEAFASQKPEIHFLD